MTILKRFDEVNFFFVECCIDGVPYEVPNCRDKRSKRSPQNTEVRFFFQKWANRRVQVRFRIRTCEYVKGAEERPEKEQSHTSSRLSKRH